MADDEIKLLVTSKDAAKRRGEPVTCGIPMPRGRLTDTKQLKLLDPRGSRVALQSRVLDRWPDGSSRWVLLDWQAEVDTAAEYVLRTDASASDLPLPEAESHSLSTTEANGTFTIKTGRAVFVAGAGVCFPFGNVMADGRVAIDVPQTTLAIEDAAGCCYEPRIDKAELTEPGPLRATLRLVGGWRNARGKQLAELEAYLHFFAGLATVRFAVTICNPRRAAHPGGLWNLGDGGSIYFRDASLTIGLPEGSGAVAVRCSPELNQPCRPVAVPCEIYQDSSGGENWRSSNHLNREHVVPHAFRGYRFSDGKTERSGLRATPIVELARGDLRLAIAMPHFWQNFPKAVGVSSGCMRLHLFPRQFADLHELQGGEQKTHEFYVAFGADAVSEEPLAWCLQPLAPRAAPEWYCATEAIPYLIPKAADPHRDYLKLVDAAIEGPDAFERKREVIDEYGWRHFGDIYGDHEAVRKKDPPPLVSHYNNQYDPLAGFVYQFLRSGDVRWRQAQQELAQHVIDIDVYHTERDKSAYNHGLFWHTIHYIDADTSTHRSYPRAERVAGGGPGSEHNYTTGLMLDYFLTGNPVSRRTAIDLARWVIDMDDGAKTVFRWLDRGYTGLASASGSFIYHGPGRGGANSLNALLDGHRLTGSRTFLDKAEQLIRRCIHPSDDIESRNLFDTERRWFYTMFLQSLGKYLDHKADLKQLDSMYAYARESLLHYARWMADREYPYLTKPEILEFPTETWAAQDMRKGEIFNYAAKHAAERERARFLERAEFFFNYSTATLNEMPTHSLCRPTVLLLSNGFMQAWFGLHSETAAPPATDAPTDLGRPQSFVPQKVRAMRRFRILAAAGGLMAAIGAAYAAFVVLLR